MAKNAQNTPTQHHLVQAPSGLWLPRKHLSQKQTQSSTRQQPWTEKILAGKTLWEWMSLLLVPLLIGIGTIAVTWQQTYAQNALSQQQYKSAQDIAQQARYDDFLKDYRGVIDMLMLDKKLKTSTFGSEVRSVAYSHTMDVLQQVDPSRKGKAIAYIANLGLVQGTYPGYVNNRWSWQKKEPIISLRGADLNRANLSGADFYKADLSGADLNRANLEGVYFYDADLNRADLSGADLSIANLGGSNLKSADLEGANLNGADLNRANLSGADLSFANLSGAKNTTPSQLSQAKSLSGTIMPDGTRHPCTPMEQGYCQ